MNTKINLLMATALIFAVGVCSAQQPEKGLRLGAIVGTKYNDFSKNYGTGIDSKVYSFTLGAGASYLYKRLIIGGEFYQSSARKTNSNESLQYAGSFTNVILGYSPFQRGSSRVETSLGFGLSNNQLIGQDDQNTEFVNVYNNQFSISPSLSYYNIGSNGLCWGLRLSYSIGTGGDTEWKYKSSDEESVFKSNVNALVLQFTMGGIVEFISGNKK